MKELMVGLLMKARFQVIKTQVNDLLLKLQYNIQMLEAKHSFLIFDYFLFLY